MLESASKKTKRQAEYVCRMSSVDVLPRASVLAWRDSPSSFSMNSGMSRKVSAMAGYLKMSYLVLIESLGTSTMLFVGDCG